MSREPYPIAGKLILMVVALAGLWMNINFSKTMDENREMKADLAEYRKAHCYPLMANDAPSSTKWDELYKVPVSHLQCK